MLTGPESRDPGGLRDRRREASILDGLVEAVAAGESRVLVMRGEAGIGKTALLDYAAEHPSAGRVARATGVQSEMELAFAALHQLCAPMVDHIGRLPAPQGEALRTVLGIRAGPPPDRFLVGLAVLGLFSEVAEQQPLLCLVDDEQWLDQASAQALGFVARRLAAESVGLVFCAREPTDELTGLPELLVEGLPADDARALLESALTGPLDDQVRNRIITEANGNPLALLELPRGLTPTQLAGGFGLPGAVRLAGRVEGSFRYRLQALPDESRRLLQLAAADPSGDPPLVWRAAERLGIPAQAAGPAVEADFIEFFPQVRFRHPLVRSAAYQSASAQGRREMHAALAEATDAVADPDRRAWHRAHASPGPDESVAAELESSAGRAQDRGGLAAAAAFLERAAVLTPDPLLRAQRQLAAARARRNAGDHDQALSLLASVESGRLNALEDANLQRLRGQIAADQARSGEAAALLLGAAQRFESLDVALARATYVEALIASASSNGEPGGQGGTVVTSRSIAVAGRGAPSGPEPARPVDVLLDGLATWFTEGYTAAAPSLVRAVEMYLELDVDDELAARRWLWMPGSGGSNLVALELWDNDSWHAIAARLVQVSRSAGSLALLQLMLNSLANVFAVEGELNLAADLIEEDEMIAKATRNPPVGYAAMIIAAWRGNDAEASQLIDVAEREAAARGWGVVVNTASWARAVLFNGRGQHAAALDAAQVAFERNQLGNASFVLPELAEAAARTGERALLATALAWISERALATPTPWVLGIEARTRALLNPDDTADAFYRQSIAHLSGTRLRPELARTHLLYGEWLRRGRHRSAARDQLRTAHDMFDSMGMLAFAERARRELRATGEAARPRALRSASSGLPVEVLTAQETQVARLARDGLTNPEIGARLFISRRTVQYHLSNVFTKFDIKSRAQLLNVLPKDIDPAPMP
jgi:DNA-binding CsgD family transcriptional regulator